MSLGFGPDNMQEWGGAILTVTTVMAAVVGWFRWLRPRIKKTSTEVVAIRDSILGREAIRDTITGREIEPALPGIGVRMAENEHQMGILTNAVAKIADSHVRIERLEADVAELKAASVERIAARAEGVALWHAVEAVANTEPAEQIESD